MFEDVRNCAIADKGVSKLDSNTGYGSDDICIETEIIAIVIGRPQTGEQRTVIYLYFRAALISESRFPAGVSGTISHPVDRIKFCPIIMLSSSVTLS